MDWDPIKDMLNIHERVNRIFQDSFQKNTSAGEWSPPVDIYETDTEVVLLVELPGISEDSIDVEVSSSVLTIKGEKLTPVVQEETEHYFRLERRFGKFKRSFSLPSVIDPDSVTASISDGILKIVLYKNNDKCSKTIKVTKG